MRKNSKGFLYIIMAASVSLLISTEPASAVGVFSENFANGNFSGWSQTFISPGSDQIIDSGVAYFTVPTPIGGDYSYSFIEKNGFTSTPNSTIIASQDIRVTKVPHGDSQGLGAIFFFYLCDSTDLRGTLGNFGVGIDGSGVWSLWIGGNTVYTYLFQTTGTTPVSNTWYHVVLTVDNAAGTVVLSVNGVNVITSNQAEFTNKVHLLSLMVGMGECWWSSGSGQQGVDITNIKLDISDATSTPVPDPTTRLPTTTLTATPQTTIQPHPTHAPTQTSGPTTNNIHTPLAPTSSLTATPIFTREKSPPAILYWILLSLAIAVVICAGLVWHLKAVTKQKKQSTTTS